GRQELQTQTPISLREHEEETAHKRRAGSRSNVHVIAMLHADTPRTREGKESQLTRRLFRGRRLHRVPLPSVLVPTLGARGTQNAKWSAQHDSRQQKRTASAPRQARRNALAARSANRKQRSNNPKRAERKNKPPKRMETRETKNNGKKTSHPSTPVFRGFGGLLRLALGRMSWRGTRLLLVEAEGVAVASTRAARSASSTSACPVLPNAPGSELEGNKRGVVLESAAATLGFVWDSALDLDFGVRLLLLASKKKWNYSQMRKGRKETAASGGDGAFCGGHF
ncbi:hypothetical protein K438DRAFT_2041766, partial [Mycena galopus ATCC 62051]